MEVRFTRAEMNGIRALAISHGFTVAELLRLAVMTLHDDTAEGGEPIIRGGIGKTTLYYRL